MFEPWTCAKCGATNTTDRSTCIACNSPRPAPGAPPPLPAAGAPPPVPASNTPPSLPVGQAPVFAAQAAPIRVPASGPRSVLTKAVVSGSWTTSATPGLAGSTAQALLASARMQVQARPTLNGLEISATRVLPGGTKGWHLVMKGTDVPMRASVRLVSVPGGTAVEAAFEDTWAHFNPKMGNVYVIQQNEFDGYFRYLLMGLFQALPLAPGSSLSIEPALPLAQTPIIVCQRCGRVAPTQYAQLHQHIGAVILMFRKEYNAHLCKRCIKEVYQKYTRTTAFLGWWGIISFFLTPLTLIVNASTYNKSKQLADSLPSSRPGEAAVPVPPTYGAGGAAVPVPPTYGAGGAVTPMPPIFGPGGAVAPGMPPAAVKKPHWEIPLWIGVALGVIGILLALILSLGQSSGAGGSAGSGTSLIDELMVCPAPVFLVGLGLGLWGFLWRRRIRSQDGKRNETAGQAGQ